MRRSLSLLLSICLVISVITTGCKKKKKSSETVPGSDAYSCSIFEVPEKEGFDVASTESFFDEGSFCVSVLYQSEKTVLSSLEALGGNVK